MTAADDPGAPLSGQPPDRDRYRPLFQLADGHRRLGYQAAAARDKVTAHREYQAALGLVRQLAAIAPAEQELLRDLAAVHHREGSHAAVLGYGLAARYEYQAEQVLLQRVAQDRPEDLGLLRDLAGVHRSLADRAERDGDHAAAQREQAAEVAVLRQLALADPATGELLRAAMDSAPAAESEPDGVDPASPQPGGSRPAPPDPEQQCRDLAELAARALAVGDRATAAASYLAVVALR